MCLTGSPPAVSAGSYSLLTWHAKPLKRMGLILYLCRPDHGISWVYFLHQQKQVLKPYPVCGCGLLRRTARGLI